MRASALTALLVTLAAAQPAAAKDPLFNIPIACALGDSCYIQNYMDTDPSPAASDFTCAALTYDGHKGTDFALPTLADMHSGVDVIASAPGTVVALRDGMPDTGLTPETAASIENRECGNGVVISHGGGWQTQYCHMKQGSIIVEKGRRVATGTVLGEVGMSGRAQFPHVHLSIRKNGKPVDPFDPDGEITCGIPSTETLWQQPPAYQPGGLLSAGFTDAVPSFDAVKSGTAAQPALPSNAPAIVLWGYAFGTRAGDVLKFDISGPDGWAFATDVTLTKNQALVCRAVGKKRTLPRWPAGTFTGTVTHMRGDTSLGTQTATFDLR